MKIRMLTSLAHGIHAYNAGQEYELPDEKAREWIGRGWAESAAPEFAVDEAREDASLQHAPIRPRGRKRA